MVFLCSLELGGRTYSPFPKGSHFTMRWGSHLPLLTVLALVFVIPHDPSTRLEAWRVGSEAYRAGMRPARRTPSQKTQLAPVRTPLPGASMQASAVLLRESLEQYSQYKTLQDMVPDGLEEASKRLWNCATTRPMMTSRLVVASALRNLAAAAPPSPIDCSREGCSIDWTAFSSGEGSSGTLDLASLAAETNNTYVFTSVAELRAAYGPRERWYGDLNAHEARSLYHSLLPTDLATDPTLPYSLAERAKMAIAARKAARLYARERALLPLSLGSSLLDAVRQLQEHKAFQPHGLTEEQVWQKYLPDGVEDLEELSDYEAEEVYWRVLEKACTTNQAVDRLCGNYGAGATVGA